MKAREKLKNASKVFGLRKWRGIMIRLTEMAEREVWGIGRIKNYVLDKFEILLNNRGDYKVGSWICEFEFRRKYTFRSHQCIDSFFMVLMGK